MKFINRDEKVFLFENDQEKEVSFKPCFPGKHKYKYISVLDDDGNELAFIDDLKNLDENSKIVIMGFLNFSLDCFKIEKIFSIKEEYGIRLWDVETNKGQRKFQTQVIHWPEQIANDLYQVIDVNGDIYHINGLREGSDILDFYIN